MRRTQAQLRRLRSASHHPSFGSGWPRSYIVSGEVRHRVQVLSHDHRREEDRSWCPKETLLHCFWLRHGAQIDRGNQQGEDPRAPRQKHHLCRRRAFPSRWSVVPKLLSSTSRSVTFTSAKICTTMSCSQVARQFSKELLSGWRNIWRRWLHPRWRSRWLQTYMISDENHHHCRRRTFPFHECCSSLIS